MAKIKVIKKGQVRPTPERPPSEKTTKKAAAREMVSTVASWVSDLQQKKRRETPTSLENFFTPSPATSRP
jgi:hypothetical protein